MSLALASTLQHEHRDRASLLSIPSPKSRCGRAALAIHSGSASESITRQPHCRLEPAPSQTQVSANSDNIPVDPPKIQPAPTETRKTYVIAERQPEIYSTVLVYFADGSEGRGLWNGDEWWTVPSRNEQPVRWAELS